MVIYVFFSVCAVFQINKCSEYMVRNKMYCYQYCFASRRYGLNLKPSFMVFFQNKTFSPIVVNYYNS